MPVFVLCRESYFGEELKRRMSGSYPTGCTDRLPDGSRCGRSKKHPIHDSKQWDGDGGHSFRESAQTQH